MTFAEIPMENIDEPAAPVRASIDEAGLEELAESIDKLGLLQPLLVKPNGGRYEVIAGHRRLLACRRLGLPAVRCNILADGDDGQVLAARLHENLVRRDMTAVEEAAVYAELYEQLGDIDKVAAMVRRSRNVVERRLSLLEADSAILDACHAGQISMGVAEELNRVEDPATREYLLKSAVRAGATVEAVRGWRQQYAGINLSEALAVENPAPGVEPGDVPAATNICWLCGCDDDQHELRVRLVHTYCEKVARKNTAAMMGQGGQDGFDQ